MATSISGSLPMTEPIDPITFEVMSNALSSSADEMALTIMRSAYSPVVRDTMDYSTALCDRTRPSDRPGADARGAARHVSDAMRHLIEQFGDTMQPGDVFDLQRPLRRRGPAPAGHLRHQADLRWQRARRLRRDYGAPLAMLAGSTPGSVARARHGDLPGGAAAADREAIRGGRSPNSTVFRIIERNTRQPVHVLGDLKAQVAACSAGERGLAGTDRPLRRGSTATLISTSCNRARSARCGRRSPRCPTGSMRTRDWIDGVRREPANRSASR